MEMKRLLATQDEASRSCLVVRAVGVDGAQWKYEMEKV
jgi:hypothetical protein